MKRSNTYAKPKSLLLKIQRQFTQNSWNLACNGSTKRRLRAKPEATLGDPTETQKSLLKLA